MNPIIIGGVVLGLAWLLTRKTAGTSYITNRNGSQSAALPAAIPLMYPTPPSPQAQKQANESQASAGMLGYFPGSGFGNPWPNLSTDLTSNLPPGSDLVKLLQSFMAWKPSETAGCNGCAKKSTCQTYQPSTQFSDGTSCLSSTRAAQRRHNDLCNPGSTQIAVDNIVTSQGVTINQPRAAHTPLSNGALLPYGPRTSIPSGYQGIMDALERQIMQGMDPNLAYSFAQNSLNVLNAYSAINNWDWAANEPINPTQPYTSPEMAEQAIESGSGTPGSRVSPIGPWAGPLGWDAPTTPPELGWYRP